MQQPIDVQAAAGTDDRQGSEGTFREPLPGCGLRRVLEVEVHEQGGQFGAILQSAAAPVASPRRKIRDREDVIR
jgi:hypothetical protein